MENSNSGQADGVGSKSTSTDAINRQVLRGELTIDDAIRTGLVTRDDISEWQKRFVTVPAELSPIEGAMAPIWRFFLRSWRKYITVPLLLLVVVLPGAVTLYEASTKLWNVATSRLAPRVAEMDAPELDVCNEWVARIGRFELREESRKRKDELLDAMKRSNEWTWVDDIHIVRDVEVPAQYLLVVDMWDGISSEVAVTQEIDRLKNPDSRSSQNIIGNQMLAARPLYYARSQFESAYGKVLAACKYKEVTN